MERKILGMVLQGARGAQGAEIHLVVLIPRELGHPAPKGEGNAWSGSHQPQL